MDQTSVLDTDPKQVLFERIANTWIDRIKLAVAHVENNRLTENGKPPQDNSVYIDESDRAKVRWLNWKSWCDQFATDPEFIYQTLTEVFASHRTLNNNPKIFAVGLTVDILTGNRARQILQEQINKVYPGRENYLLRTHELRQRLSPSNSHQAFDYNEDEEMFCKYGRNVEHRRSEASQQYRRAWRGNPWR